VPCLAPPAATADHTSSHFFWATVTVECFTPTPISPSFPLSNSRVPRWRGESQAQMLVTAQ
jgi:hypothetical protein